MADNQLSCTRLPHSTQKRDKKRKWDLGIFKQGTIKHKDGKADAHCSLEY